MGLSRRRMMAIAGAAVTAGVPAPGFARDRQPDDLGVQLWMMRGSMALDLDATLRGLAALGLRRVELAGAPDLAAADLRRRFDAAGLACVSGHLPILQMTDAEVERRLAFAVEVGMTAVVAPMPGFAALLEVEPAARFERLMAHSLTADDWRWNADRLNALGQRAARFGLQLGYHNHNVEFADDEGGRPMDLLLQRVDPASAHFQLDVGNAVLGGADPVALLLDHPGRFRSAHLKDWRAPLTPTTQTASPPSSAFGEGVIDWPRWRRASAAAGIQTSFIERENLPPDQETAAVAQALAFFAALGRA